MINIVKITCPNPEKSAVIAAGPKNKANKANIIPGIEKDEKPNAGPRIKLTKLITGIPRNK